MAVPTEITLNGDYDGAVGFVDVELSTVLTLDGSSYPRTHQRAYLVDGEFSLVVKATDDDGVSPINAFYRITEYLNGQRSSKNIFVPAASAGGELDVNDAPAVAAGLVSAFVPFDDSVTTAKILDGAVTTPKIEDAAVTNAKLETPGIQQVAGGTAAILAIGTATLDTGTVTVPLLTVDNASYIIATHAVISGTAGILETSVENGVGFTIDSDNSSDDSTVSYVVFEFVPVS
jgi:hypothetical protein